MKRLWAAVSLLIISILFSAIELYLVDVNQDKFSYMIKEIEDYYSIKEYKNAYDLCIKTEQYWKNSETKLKTFLLHSEINNISDSISEIKDSIKNEDKKTFYSVCQKTKRQLLSMKESELPNFENIL